MWPGMHREHVHAGSYMHPVHDKQETSLDVRDGEDSQTLRGGRFLHVEGPIVRIKRLCSTIMCGRGLEYKQSIIISTRTLLPICSNKENLINLQIV